MFAHTGSLQFVQSAAPVPHIGTLSGAGGYSMPFHGDPKILAFCPGEVRHRKRTSRQQLSVLEDIFTTDQKPGPALRKKLALELEMTPRSVQVCDESIPKLLCGGGGDGAGAGVRCAGDPSLASPAGCAETC